MYDMYALDQQAIALTAYQTYYQSYRSYGCNIRVYALELESPSICRFAG